MEKIIFLDRDGTIIYDYGYMHDIKKLKMLPGAVKGLKRLQENNYRLMIVTNQSGIGRGYYTKKQYEKFNKKMLNILFDKGINIEKTFYCPHSPEVKCKCRKPSIIKIKEYLKGEDIDKKNSYVIGDKTSDIKLGKNLRIRSILLMTGKCGKDNKYKVKPDYKLENLDIASKRIIGIKR